MNRLLPARHAGSVRDFDRFQQRPVGAGKYQNFISVRDHGEALGASGECDCLAVAGQGDLIG